jgi:type VI secretion system protein ImpC
VEETNPLESRGPVRPPRVYITYDREVEPAIEVCELPFVIGVVADLGGLKPVPLRERKFVEVGGENLDQVAALGRAGESQRAAWEGLRYLVSGVEASAGVKIRVLEASRQELLEDFRAAGEPERSALFEKVYTEVYGTCFAEPFGMLVGDYEFGCEAEDIELLGYLSEVASAALAPFMAAASPRMFGVRTFTDLPGPGPLARRFDGEGHARWRAFRERPEAAFLGLVLPRILLPGTGRRVWGNAAYALAARVAEAFRRYGWCAAIRGVEGGGLVTGLRVDAEGGPVEAAIHDDQEGILHQLGFISLCHWKRTDRAVFFSAPSCHRPQVYLVDEATAAARLAAQLPHVLAVSRFAHYLKVMMRDKAKIGTGWGVRGGTPEPVPDFREDCERFLNEWISRYVILDDAASNDMKAMYPLREARIEVAEIPDKPGALMAIAYLRPHFQLQDLGMCQRVVAELPGSGA